MIGLLLPISVAMARTVNFCLDFLGGGLIITVILWSGKAVALLFGVIPFFELKVLIQIPDVFSF